ncbi:MAG: hypothetical protein CMG09_05135 [Candidatus Marinimicrobia bacterium]|nr:hypothetical protein [Candidatus Neomarinimicrobiota bacterium]
MKIFLRILGFVKPYWALVIGAFIASIFYAIFNAGSLWVVGTLIGTIMGSTEQIVSDHNNLSFIKKIDLLFNDFILSVSVIDQLKIVCLFLLTTFLFKNIFFYLNALFLTTIELKIVRDIRNKLFVKIQKFPLTFFDKNKTGNILSIMLNDVNLITIAFNKTFQVFFHETISMFILLTLLFSISSKLTMIVLLSSPLSAYIIFRVGQSIKRRTERGSHKVASITNLLIEKITGIKIVKAFNMSIKEINNFFNDNYKYYKINLSQRNLLNMITPINDIIGVILASILLWYGGQQVLITQEISSDEFMRFIIFLFALLQPVRKLSGSLASIQTGIVGASRVLSILDNNLNEKDDSLLKSKMSFDKYIKFDKVNFQYDLNGPIILKNINVVINKGKKIALVGSSGSGKSTFANLLLNFYEPNKGKISIDDQNYKDIKITSIRSLVGLVSQQPILFNDSIKNNIGYGSKNTSLDLIIKASKTANIYNYIQSLKNKFNTIIGERGTLLSGGQKQRLSIARAVLKNSPILILDEATSSLDSESEVKVQKAIDNLVKDRTVVMIAHRLSTIKNADEIFVFDNGEIKERGNHIDLYKQNGIYANLYKMQFDKKDE